jgi:multidrug efflux system membrane fusion protein
MHCIPNFNSRRLAVKTFLPITLIAITASTLETGCTPEKPAAALRPVRTLEVNYDVASEVNRYVGTVQPRHEVDYAFRVGGKIAQRRVEVGQTVREGDVMAVLDDADYRLAEEAARQQFAGATAQARQAEADRLRLGALKKDGSVSVSDDEHAQSKAQTAQADAEAEAKKLDLARNRLKYTVLYASHSGVVTAVRFEIGQVVAEGQPIVSIADNGEPEIVVDVPEDHLSAFKNAQFKASLASAPEDVFDVALRELSPAAAQQTRTYRARLKPVQARRLALGATATLVANRAMGKTPVASIPATALTQAGGKPALWIVKREGAEPVGTVDLIRIAVQGYRNDQVLVTGPRPGELIVTAGVQKMAPGLKVSLAAAARSTDHTGENQ